MINEDGRINTLSLLNSPVEIGSFLGLMLQGSCTTSITAGTTYLSASPLQNSMCIDTNNDTTNFIEANCSGDWIVDNNGEKYCNGVIGTSCTTTLNGSEFPKFEMTLIPNTTLPTINW